MKQNEILHLLMDTNTLIPDKQYRKEYITHKIKESGHSIQCGIKAVSYYYAELQKAFDGKKSIFYSPGKILNEDGHYVLCENDSTIFKMSPSDFLNLGAVIEELNQNYCRQQEPPRQPTNCLDYSLSKNCASIEFLQIMAPEIRQELEVNPILDWDFNRIMKFFVQLIRDLQPLRLYQIATYRILFRTLDNLGGIQSFIENWLLKAFNTDDTFVYAYNFIAQSESMRTGVTFPQKNISLIDLNQKINLESIRKSSFPFRFSTPSPHPSCHKGSHSAIKTDSEHEFFNLIEYLPPNGNVDNPLAIEYKNQLFNLYDDLRAEIIGNITRLSASDREFYLKRLLKRTNDIPVSAFVKEEADSAFIPMESMVSHGEKTLLIEPVQLSSHFRLITHFKTELLCFLISQMEVENSVEEIIPAVKSAMAAPIVSGTSEISSISLDEMKNNFDSTPIHKVYDFFERELVAKKLLPENQLIAYLYFAFHKKEQPPQKFRFLKTPPKARVIKIFYTYFSEIALKPFSKQKKYAALLGDYFEGFDTANVSSNFSK